MDVGALSWGVERRLEFLELKLYWEGRFNRSDLIEEFGISVPQASLDIRRYEALAPGNMTYDRVSRAYVCTGDFRPAVKRPSADRYMARLRAVGEGAVARSEVSIGRPPEFDVVPQMHRGLDDEVTRRVGIAIRRRSAILVTYQSFSSPEPRNRWLAPHAFVNDGRRWHARAWCYERKRFADFALGRVERVSDERVSGISPESDEAWTTSVALRIAPHPGLSPGMRRAVEVDYGMRGGHAEVVTRRALVFYLYKNFGFERDAETTPAHEYHVILLNREEIRRIVSEADERSNKGERP